MDPAVQIHLGYDIQAPFFINIKNHACFHAISDGKRNFIEHIPITGIFTRKGLDDLSQFGEKQGKQRSDDKFGDPTASGGSELVFADGNRPVVERFGILDVIVKQQRPISP